MSIIGKIEIRKGAKGAKANGGAKWTLPEITEDMKIKYADALKANTPRNGVTKREYTGDNVYRLIAAQLAKDYTDGRWYTFNQLQSIGARIKKGEHGTKIMGWWSNAGDDAEAMAAGLTEEEMRAARKAKPKIYILFNAEQCTGIATAPEAVATVKETKETKYKNIIKGSFEIKPKAKKTEKKVEKKAAPVATDKTAEKITLITESLKAIERLKKAVPAWNGKVCNVKFWQDMKQAARGDLPEGYGANAGISTYKSAFVEVYSTRDYSKFIHVFYSPTVGGILKEMPGKMPRIDSAAFVAILEKTQKELTEELNVIKKTVQNADEIKAAMEKMKELSKFLQGFDREILVTQEMTDKYKVDSYLRF